MNLKAALLATAAAGAFLVAACGGGSSDSNDSGSGSSSTSSGSSQPQNDFLVAPQLMVVANGPVTATFLGASQPFGQLVIATVSTSGGVGSREIWFGGSVTPGTQAQVLISSLGSNVTFAATFGTQQSLSSTAASQEVINLIKAPTPIDSGPNRTITFNAGVVRTGADSVQVGFNPPGMAQPSTFDNFAVRISLSNVSVR